MDLLQLSIVQQKNTITSLFDKEFVINTNKQYLSPNLIGKDSNTGNFLIEGPRNKVLESK